MGVSLFKVVGGRKYIDKVLVRVFGDFWLKLYGSLGFIGFDNVG